MKSRFIKHFVLWAIFFGVNSVLAQTNNSDAKNEVKTVSFKPPVTGEPDNLSKLEKNALNQFLSFCKNQIDVENGGRNSTNYTIMIVEALQGEGERLYEKSEIKSKLDEVNSNPDLRYKFLTYFTGIIGEETSNLYFILRPAESDTRFVSRISTTDADILSNMMLSHFYRPIIKEVDETEKQEVQEKPQIYIAVDKEASYVGGAGEMFKFIQKNIIIPEKPTAQDLGTFSLRIYLSFVVNADGTLGGLEIMRHNEQYSLFEDAVINCFKKMPNWKPAEIGGKSVASQKTEVVNIALND